MPLCHHTNFKESKSKFDFVATTNQDTSQDCTNNKHCVNQGMTGYESCASKHENINKICVNKSCGEDEFKDEFIFYHIFQQINTYMIWGMTWQIIKICFLKYMI